MVLIMGNATNATETTNIGKKLRKKLSKKTLPPKRERGLFGGTLGVGVSKINRRRKMLEESLDY